MVEEVFLSYDELIDLFSKYDYNDLISFDYIIKYTDLKNDLLMTDALKIVSSKKIIKEEVFDDYIYETLESQPSSLIKYNKYLTEKELNFIHYITDEAIYFLGEFKKYYDECNLVDIEKLDKSIKDELTKREYQKTKRI